MSDPNPAIPNDLALLLNAYLDRQLSPAQAARIEQRLAADPRARQLLDDLRQVSQDVAGLSRMDAPEDLSDGIMLELERAALLQVGQMPTERAGRLHLRWRRLAAAAAIFILAGAIVAIVYSVWNKPAEPPTAPDDPLIGLRSQSAAPGSNSAIETNDIEWSAPAYGQIHLVVHTADPQASEADLEGQFTRHGIENVLRTPWASGLSEYAFVCTTDALADVVRVLDGQSTRQTDLYVRDPAGARDLLIPHATTAQILTLARIKDRQERMALAWTYQQQVEHWTLDLPDVLAANPPYLFDLRPLGPNQLPAIPSIPSGASLASPLGRGDSDLPTGGQPDDRADSTADAYRPAGEPYQTSISLVAVQITLLYARQDTVPADRLDPEGQSGNETAVPPFAPPVDPAEWIPEPNVPDPADAPLP